MANDKDIKLGIVTTANTAGAKEAEAALNKVAEATKNVAQAEATGFGRDTAAAKRIAALEAAEAAETQAKALTKVKEAEESLAEGLGELKTATDDFTESTEKATVQTGELDENVANIARAQRAAALADLARNVGLIGGKFREAAGEIREFDAEAAEKLEATGDRIEKVTGAVSQLALGFAVGGPLGAGVAAIGILVSSLVDEFMRSEVAAAKAAAAQSQAQHEVADAVRETMAAEAERRVALSAGEVLGALDRELESMREITVELERQLELTRTKRRLENEVLQAEDQAALAEVDRLEAAGQIDPKKADQERIKIEQAARKRAFDERKTVAIEDAQQANAAAKIKLDEQATAEQSLEKLRKMRSKVEVDERFSGEDAQISLDKLAKKTARGDTITEDDKKSARDAVQKAETAQIKLRTYDDAIAEAEGKLAEIRKQAADAMRAITQKNEEAQNVSAALERVTDAERRRDESRGFTRDITARKKEQAEERKQRERDDAKAARGRDRDIPRRADLAEEEGTAVGRTDTALEGTRGSRFFPPVQKARKALEDGATGDEYTQLGAELESFVAALTNIDAKKKADISALARQFRDLGERVKRLENP